MKRLSLILSVILILTLVVVTYLLGTTRASPVEEFGMVVMPQPDTAGFSRADGPRRLVFPADFGPHPDFQTEWWYYTGNLETPGGQHFGYQLTFFRRAIQPPAERQTRSSNWAAEQVYLAHFTLTDVAGNHFHAFERLERGSAGLAGAEVEPNFNVWLDNWQVKGVRPGIFLLQASVQGVSLSLELKDQKGPVLQGDQGYSQKGKDPGNASYYYSQTRLISSGSIELDGKSYQVSGLSWMDHEFSTSGLAPQQIGWDWFSIQLDNGYDVMVYTLRNQDGSIDRFSNGTLIAPDGATRRLESSDFIIKNTASWSSPHTGTVYPAGWSITIPTEGIVLELQPYLADQELRVSFTYWEGAVKVTGSFNGQRGLTGNGYVELTGYAHTMQGRF
jgi:predicted secreted hydrolase